MKYIVVLGDGMSDWKIKELGGKTCLEAANTPYLDKFRIGFRPESFLYGTFSARSGFDGY